MHWQKWLILHRNEGSYQLYQSMAEKIPRKNKCADDQLDETEVITRMLYSIHKFNILNLETLDWEVSFILCYPIALISSIVFKVRIQKRFKDLGIDSLETTAILTTIEEEFHTIFEDRLFENFENFNQVKLHIVQDHNCF